MPPMKLASTKKLATPESSGKTSRDLSSMRTRKLCAVSVKPVRKRPFFSTLALGATSTEIGVSVGLASKPQRMQRVTSSGMRLVQFGHFFMVFPLVRKPYAKPPREGNKALPEALFDDVIGA